jgi:hypothetical protein
MKAKFAHIYREHVAKKTTIGNSVNSKRRHGRKNKQKKFSCDYKGQGK